jgi:tetratricopeptide (TPR) repeat protein
MDKESSVISWIKNRILSIIYRLKKRNTEPGVTEEKEQPVNSEPISRSENETETHSPDKKQLIDLKKDLGEGIDAILNKLFEGISGLLEDEYKERLIGLERRIEELKKKGEEELVSHLKAYKGELDEVRNLAKTAKLSSEENIEKIAKITIVESEIEELKRKVREIGLTDVPTDKLKGTTTVPNHIKQALNVEDIENITKIRSIIEKMKQNGKNIPKKEDLETLEKISFSKRMAALISAEAIETFKAPLLDRDMTLKEILERVVSEASRPKELLEEIRKELKPFKIESSYRMGIALLKKKAYEEAKNCFEEIINLDSNLKGAWLNKGVALGGLCEIKEEIKCYGVILNTIDEIYKKARHNKKIAERKMGRTK